MREVRLPYPVKDSHGEDLRDYLCRDKHSVHDLIALAAATTPAVARSATGTTAAAADRAPSHAPEGATTGSLFDAGGDVPADEPIAAPAAGGVPSAPAAPSTSQQGRDAASLLDLIGLDVLGDYTGDNGAIDMYSRNCQKVEPIPSIDHDSYRKLVQTCGDVAFLNHRIRRPPLMPEPRSKPSKQFIQNYTSDQNVKNLPSSPFRRTKFPVSKSTSSTTCGVLWKTREQE